MLVGNLDKLAKNRQVGIICHINVKRNQEAGNRQTDRQSTVTLVRMRRALIIGTTHMEGVYWYIWMMLLSVWFSVQLSYTTSDGIEVHILGNEGSSI